MDNASQPEPRRNRKAARPLDKASLRDLALSYVARFATSSGKLRAYCRRKLRERGHVGAEEGAPPPDVDALVADFVTKGYVDDAGFAQTKADGLLRRGYGARRIGAALHADGIDADLRESVAPGEADRREAAVAYARRRRFGPFSRDPGAWDEGQRQKQLAAMLRAGHSHGLAAHALDAENGQALEAWIAEAQEDNQC